MLRIKMVQYGIQYKYSMQKMINHGYLDKDIVIWETFIKDVCKLIKKMIYHNFHIRNYLVIQNKILFKNVKNNYKTIIIHY